MQQLKITNSDQDASSQSTNQDAMAPLEANPSSEQKPGILSMIFGLFLFTLGICGIVKIHLDKEIWIYYVDAVIAAIALLSFIFRHTDVEKFVDKSIDRAAKVFAYIFVASLVGGILTVGWLFIGWLSSLPAGGVLILYLLWERDRKKDS